MHDLSGFIWLRIYTCKSTTTKHNADILQPTWRGLTVSAEKTYIQFNALCIFSLFHTKLPPPPPHTHTHTQYKISVYQSIPVFSFFFQLEHLALWMALPVNLEWKHGRHWMNEIYQEYKYISRNILYFTTKIPYTNVHFYVSQPFNFRQVTDKRKKTNWNQNRT